VQLPWWVLTYLFVYMAIGIAAAVQDYRSNNRVGWAAGEILSTALGSLFVLALWRESLQQDLGKAVVPLFVGALAWEVVSAAHDFSSTEPDPELSPEANRAAERIGVALSFLLVAPALIAGAVLSWRATVAPAA
jgi:hypothetical protein